MQKAKPKLKWFWNLWLNPNTRFPQSDASWRRHVLGLWTCLFWVLFFASCFRNKVNCGKRADFGFPVFYFFHTGGVAFSYLVIIKSMTHTHNLNQTENSKMDVFGICIPNPPALLSSSSVVCIWQSMTEFMQTALTVVKRLAYRYFVDMRRQRQKLNGSWS
jgi:hypothetical protein